MNLGQPGAQTKIALFVGAAKTVNAAILCAAELRPHLTIGWSVVCAQCLRELAFATLLARVTHWSADPAIYAQGTALAAPLWTEWWRIQRSLGGSLDAGSAYAAFSLGHALLARVHLAPVIAGAADRRDPFVAALRRIDQGKEGMIQAQNRLLEDGTRPLRLEQRERLIEAHGRLVDEGFSRFLQWLAYDVDQ
jgi:hypothetical protein